jgi:hypothetical protein
MLTEFMTKPSIKPQTASQLITNITSVTWQGNAGVRAAKMVLSRKTLGYLFTDDVLRWMAERVLRLDQIFVGMQIPKLSIGTLRTI